MPARPDDPLHEGDSRRSARWSDPTEGARREPTAEPGWREARWPDEPDPPGAPPERRQAYGGGGTFTRQPAEATGRSPAGPAGPGSSYGRGSGGRADGSQAWGERDPLQAGTGPDSAEFSQSVYDRGRGLREPARPDRPSQAWSRHSPPGNDREPPPPGWRQREAEPRQRHLAERVDDTQFDADYRQWREEQMRMLDREYAQWRRERYRKFAEEFSQWRSRRLQPMGGQATPPDAPTSAPADDPTALGNASALGPADAGMRATDAPPDRHRQEERGGGLLSSLLGGHGERHSERHKPKP